MSNTEIFSHHDESLLYHGKHDSIIATIEDAYTEGHSLNRANLNGAKINNITLDGLEAHDMHFINANMSGANLSETTLTNCNFSGAHLVDACLAEATLKSCILDYAMFGGTDISGAQFINCHFAGLSCFSLNYMSAAYLERLIYRNDDTQEVEFSQPPIVINGVNTTPIILFDRHTKIEDGLFERPANRLSPIDDLLSLLQSCE